MQNTTDTTTAEAHHRIGRGSRLAAASLGALLLLGACSTPERAELADPAAPQEASTTTEAATVETTPAPSTTEALEASATPTTPTRAISQVPLLTVVDAPGSTTVVTELADRTEFGSARVLAVEQVIDGWVQVELPVRPNGSTGWVRAGQVRLETLTHRVAIDLAARQLTVYVDGQVQQVVDVAVGSADNPTPTGSFFVVDKLDTTNDAGAYGPYAFGLSAHSETLTEFAGGDGQIGIHGTNDPTSIGRAVSHGCIRLPNETITQLSAELPLGTPVVIS